MSPLAFVQITTYIDTIQTIFTQNDAITTTKTPNKFPLFSHSHLCAA